MRSEGTHAYDPDLHEPGSTAASGGCSVHQGNGSSTTCTGEAVVSFRDQQGRWQSACPTALEELVDRGEIEPLGQGA